MDPTKHPDCIDREALRLTAELASVREKRSQPLELRYAAAFGSLYQAIAMHLDDHPHAPGSIELRTTMLRATAYTMTDAEFAELLAEPLTDPTTSEQDVADELLDQLDDDRNQERDFAEESYNEHLLHEGAL